MFLSISLNIHLNQVKVDPEAIAFVHEKFAPPSDPVFELVPPLFAQYAGQAYAQMGSPELDSQNIWQVYRYIVERLQEITARRANIDEDYIDTVDQWQVTEFLHDQDEVPELPYPLPNGRELFGGFENPREDGSVYLGGVNEGRGLGVYNISLTFSFLGLLSNKALIRCGVDKKIRLPGAGERF